MELEGHTDDGIGLRLRQPDVLIVGDYLSPIEYPFVYHSTVAYRSTLAGLADLLRRDPPALVIPGHGAPLEAAQALEIAASDLEYLHTLRRTVAASLEAGADRDAAVEAGSAVPPPRALPVDSGESRRNAERQYQELVAC
jgi:hydroxyacylglutathione hydrolase